MIFGCIIKYTTPRPAVWQRGQSSFRYLWPSISHCSRSHQQQEYVSCSSSRRSKFVEYEVHAWQWHWHWQQKSCMHCRFQTCPLATVKLQWQIFFSALLSSSILHTVHSININQQTSTYSIVLDCPTCIPPNSFCQLWWLSVPLRNQAVWRLLVLLVNRCHHQRQQLSTWPIQPKPTDVSVMKIVETTS